MDEEITGRLENWYVDLRGSTMIIWGQLYDDVRKRWRDGEYVHTSSAEIKEVKEGDIVHTRNSVYLLGVQSPHKVD